MLLSDFGRQIKLIAITNSLGMAVHPHRQHRFKRRRDNQASRPGLARRDEIGFEASMKFDHTLIFAPYDVPTMARILRSKCEEDNKEVKYDPAIFFYVSHKISMMSSADIRIAFTILRQSQAQIIQQQKTKQHQPHKSVVTLQDVFAVGNRMGAEQVSAIQSLSCNSHVLLFLMLICQSLNIVLDRCMFSKTIIPYMVEHIYPFLPNLSFRQIEQCLSELETSRVISIQRQQHQKKKNHRTKRLKLGGCTGYDPNATTTLHTSSMLCLSISFSLSDTFDALHQIQSQSPLLQKMLDNLDPLSWPVMLAPFL
jgi:hypothetical protein